MSPPGEGSPGGSDVRLALILGGGVSLGAYTAGAVSEILLALSRNRRARVTVDVIAGASAGAVTAGLAARALAVNPSLLPWLERVWVDALDAEVLLDSRRRDPSALLDTDAVEELSRHLIAADPAADDRPSPSAGDPLRVGITLSNLTGVEYDLRYGFLNAPDRFYRVRVHRDWAEFDLAPGTPAGAPVWERLRSAVVASAAFPLAFPPRRLERNTGDYPGARFPAGAGDSVGMWYADGGLFDNRPVGLAKRLVERVPDHRAADWRYILVDPYMEGGAGTGTGEAPLDPSGSPVRAGAAVVRALLGQGAALDWIEANKVNARLEILEALVARLPEIGDRIRDPGALAVGRSVGELAERVAEMKVAVRRTPDSGVGDPVLAYLDENIARIQADPRFTPAFDGVEGRPTRTRIAKLVFVLESAAGLRDKEIMPLYLVAPKNEEPLAGRLFGNFGGFLHREWRAHDFRAGRRDARRLLEEGLDGAIGYDPDAPEAYETRPVDASFDALPSNARASLERFVRHEAGRVLDELQPGLLGHLTAWAWKPVLRRWAARRALGALRRMG